MCWQETAVVLPCYNEERRVGRVLRVLRSIEPLTQIVVVDDGSTDQTAKAAALWLRPKDKLLRLERNNGKAQALWSALPYIASKWVLFLDADLSGLSVEHLEALCMPVWQADAQMGVAVLGERAPWVRWVRYLGGRISGQRCLSLRSALFLLRELRHSGYGVEIGLTVYAALHGWKVSYVVWEGVSHPLKEAKYGWLHGLWRQGVAWKQMGKTFVWALRNWI